MAATPKKYIVTDGELTLLLETAEEGGYVVTSPFNPDVMTQGDTLEEAFEMARDVIQTYADYRAEKAKAAQPASKATRPKGRAAAKKTA